MGKQPALGCTSAAGSHQPHASPSRTSLCLLSPAHLLLSAPKHLPAGQATHPLWQLGDPMGLLLTAGCCRFLWKSKEGLCTGNPAGCTARSGASCPSSANPKKPMVEGASGTLGGHQAKPIYPPTRQVPWSSSGVITQAELRTEHQICGGHGLTQITSLPPSPRSPTHRSSQVPARQHRHPQTLR